MRPKVETTPSGKRREGQLNTLLGYGQCDGVGMLAVSQPESEQETIPEARR